MKVFVQGLWHCGCVVSACLASLKHEVIAYDDNKSLIKKLKKNILPIFEPKLKDLIKNSIKDKKLFFVNNLKNLNTANIVWFTYDTPVDENDRASTKNIIDKIKKTLQKLNSNKYIIISSQLPVGSTELLEKYAKREWATKGTIYKDWTKLTNEDRLIKWTKSHVVYKSPRYIENYKPELANLAPCDSLPTDRNISAIGSFITVDIREVYLANKSPTLCVDELSNFIFVEKEYSYTKSSVYYRCFIIFFILYLS